MSAMKDSFGRDITYLRLSVTELCNLRCRYCMPESGIVKKQHDEMLTEDEMIQVVKAAASLGISKLRITGGEPLVKRNILSICKRTCAVEGIQETALTTNATLLSQYAKPLKDSGISRLNISLDTLDAEKYRYITRCGTLDDALRGIDAAINAGFEKIKINTVLIGGFNTDEINQLASLTVKWPVDVRFIELMPMVDKEFNDEAFIPCSIVLQRLTNISPSGTDGVAKLFRLPNAQGNVGLISPISAHFCSECNRIRVTADGKIKPCLHSSTEYSLKGLDFNSMCTVLQTAIWSKPASHIPLSSSELSEAGRSMNQIGG